MWPQPVGPRRDPEPRRIHHNERWKVNKRQFAVCSGTHSTLTPPSYDVPTWVGSLWNRAHALLCICVQAVPSLHWRHFLPVLLLPNVHLCFHLTCYALGAGVAQSLRVGYDADNSPQSSPEVKNELHASPPWRQHGGSGTLFYMQRERSMPWNLLYSAGPHKWRYAWYGSATLPQRLRPAVYSHCKNKLGHWSGRVPILRNGARLGTKENRNKGKSKERTPAALVRIKDWSFQVRVTATCTVWEHCIYTYVIQL
jgi:hypothetical protein